MIDKLDIEYVFEDNDSSASEFGWDFQENAGIFLFLHYIKEAQSVAVESKNQDIEIILKVIEEVLGTKLIMVLDSPRGKELDDENLKLMMQVVEEDLKENQVFIASIYDDFKYDKKIKLTGKAIGPRE